MSIAPLIESNFSTRSSIYEYSFIHSLKPIVNKPRVSASVCVNVYLLASIMEYKQQIFA